MLFLGLPGGLSAFDADPFVLAMLTPFSVGCICCGIPALFRQPRPSLLVKICVIAMVALAFIEFCWIWVCGILYLVDNYEATPLLVTLIIAPLLMSLWGVGLGVAATGRNRDFLSWAVIGALFSVIGAVALMVTSVLCPGCEMPLSNRDWKARKCPKCGDIA
jgi:hypothetical protein